MVCDWLFDASNLRLAYNSCGVRVDVEIETEKQKHAFVIYERIIQVVLPSYFWAKIAVAIPPTPTQTRS